MRFAPDRLRPERTVVEPGDQMPVHVRDHIAEKLVVDLGRLKDPIKGSGHLVDLFNDPLAGLDIEMEELNNVGFCEDKGVTAEELVTIEGHIAVIEFSDTQINVVFPFSAHGAIGLF